MSMEVQDEIGHASFGTFSALWSLGFLFIALSDLGLYQYSTKTIAGDQALFQKIFPNLISLKLVLTLVYPVFMLGVGWVLGYEMNELYLLFLLCCAHAFGQMVWFFRGSFQAFQKFKLDAFASVLDRAILLGIIAVLFYQQNVTLNSFVLGWLTSMAAAMTLLYFGVLKIFGWILPEFKMSKVKGFLKAGLPFAIITVLYSVNDRIDQVMLERMIGSEQTGFYAAAYRWVDAIMMFLWIVLPIFFAKFAFHIRSPEKQKTLLDFGQSITALPMIFAGVFVFIYPEKLLFMFDRSTPEELSIMGKCLQVLFISVIINGIFAIFSTLLTSTNHEKFVSRMIGISIVMNITLNYIFIPEYGPVASAWTTGLSYAFLSVSYLIYIQIKLPFNISFLQLGKIFLIGGIFATVFYFLSQTTLHWFLVSFIAGLLLLGMSLGSKMIKFGEDIDEGA